MTMNVPKTPYRCPQNALAGGEEVHNVGPGHRQAGFRWHIQSPVGLVGSSATGRSGRFTTSCENSVTAR